MKDKNNIQRIIFSLRKHANNGTLDETIVFKFTTELSRYGYQYAKVIYPTIPPDYHWPIPTLNAPQTLSEALLWKMGKWSIYKSFVEHYKNSTSVPAKTDVVFYAFAKHLRDSTRPIYDQHVLRALWAIDTNLTVRQIGICHALLINKKDGKWKPIASGSKTQEGYDLYVDRIINLCKGGATQSSLDKLFMPLGRAIKENTANIDEFMQFIGCITH